MANINAPFGFKPVLTDGKQSRVTRYLKTAGAAIFPGDCVQLVAAGTVSVAGVTGTILGVAAEYKAAADAGEIAVYDDPSATFVAQMSTFALADVGLNAPIVATTGDTLLLNSKQSINATGADVTATIQIKLLGLAPEPDNEVGAFAKVLCKINNHVFSAGTTGI